MRFLCLHGRGTNAKIFEMQLAAIRYELGDSHTYDFVEGCVPWELDPAMQKVMPGEQQAFAFYDDKAESALKAFDDFGSFVDAEGPYDGVIAFSMGVPLVTTWMVHQIKQGKSLRANFSCAIFFSAPPSAYDVDDLRKGKFRLMDDSEADGLINIPTAHIWGERDPWAHQAQAMTKLFWPQTTSVFVHKGGHEVPGASAGHAVAMSVNMIRRTIKFVETMERQTVC